MLTNQQNNALTSCPSCDSAWGVIERDFQHCDHCGYPLETSRNSAAKRPKTPVFEGFPRPVSKQPLTYSDRIQRAS